MKKSILVFSLLLTSLLSCSEFDDNLYKDSVCDQITKVDNSRYKSNQSEGFAIGSTKTIGDCLKVEIESGGCSGNTWKVELIDADRVAESNQIRNKGILNCYWTMRNCVMLLCLEPTPLI